MKKTVWIIIYVHFPCQVHNRLATLAQDLDEVRSDLTTRAQGDRGNFLLVKLLWESFEERKTMWD